MSGIISSREAKARRWRELLAEQAVSGRTIPQFCLSHNVSLHMFYYWRKKLCSKIAAGAKQQNATNRFIPVAKRTDFRVASPRIILPNGVTIDLGASLESDFVNQFLLNLCGVGLTGGHRAKS